MKLYIQENQSAASTINQLSRVDNQDIKLVFPENTNFFNSLENLELLVSQAALLNKNISIVTENPSHASISQRFGINIEAPGNILSNQKSTPVNDLSDDQYFNEISKEEDNDENEQEFTRRYFDLGGIKKPAHDEQLRVVKSEINDEPIVQDEPFMEEQEIEQEFPEQVEEQVEEKIEPKPKKKRSNFSFNKNFDIGKLLLNFRFIILVVVLIAGFWGYFNLPKAEIKIFSVKEKISFPVEISAKEGLSGIDVELRQIPVQIIEINKVSEKNATAVDVEYIEKNTEGTITVFNELSKPQVMIPSRFKSSNGNIYWSTRNIKIPARSSLDIKIVAAAPGEKYNLECSKAAACEFTIPAWLGTENYNKVYARATNKLEGGFKGNAFKVEGSEHKTVQSEMRQELLKAAQEELNSKIPAGFALVEESMQSDLSDLETTSNGPEGEYTIKGELVLRAFMFRDTDLVNLINHLIKSQIKKERVPFEDSIEFKYAINTVDYENNLIKLDVNATEDVGWVLEIDNLVENLAGKKENEVRKIITNIDNISGVEVVLWPFWVHHIPSNTERIDILLDSY